MSYTVSVPLSFNFSSRPQTSARSNVEQLTSGGLSLYGAPGKGLVSFASEVGRCDHFDGSWINGVKKYFYSFKEEDFSSKRLIKPLAHTALIVDKYLSFFKTMTGKLPSISIPLSKLITPSSELLLEGYDLADRYQEFEKASGFNEATYNLLQLVGTAASCLAIAIEIAAFTAIFEVSDPALVAIEVATNLSEVTESFNTYLEEGSFDAFIDLLEATTSCLLFALQIAMYTVIYESGESIILALSFVAYLSMAFDIVSKEYDSARSLEEKMNQTPKLLKV